MFNLTALNPITITQFYTSIDAAADPDYIRIYYMPGALDTATNAQNPSAWTLIDSAITTSTGFNVPTLIPITVNVSIPAGQTYAFYITGVGPNNLDYTDGDTLNEVYVADANIQVRQGIGISYPFGNMYVPRVFNGIVDYCEDPLGIQEQAATTITLSPNPFSSHAELTFGKVIDAEVRIFDMLGKQVMFVKAAGVDKISISREGMRAGIYFAHITENGKLVGVQKMVVE